MIIRVLAILGALTLSAPSYAAEIFHFSGQGDPPPTGGSPATRIVTSGATQHQNVTADYHNFYQINYDPDSTTCYNFHGTILNDFQPKRCKDAPDLWKPCTVDGDCPSGTTGDCADVPIRVYLYWYTPAKICSGGTNALDECSANGDCNSNSCVDNTGNSLFQSGFKCFASNADYLAGTAPSLDTVSAQTIAHAAADSLLHVSGAGYMSATTGCHIGDEYVLRMCRIGADGSDTLPGQTWLVSYLVTM